MFSCRFFSFWSFQFFLFLLFSAYVTETSETKKWNNARDDCAGLGKNLGTVIDQATNEFFRNLFSTDFWIGLKKNRNEIWKWNGNSISTYRNWDSNKGSSACVYVKQSTGKWATDDCSNKKPYVCTSLES